MHASNDDIESWEYIAAILPELAVHELRQKVEQQRLAWFEPGAVENITVLRELSHGRAGVFQGYARHRGKVFLIRLTRDGTHIVGIYKVFRKWASRFFEREVYASTELQQTAPYGSTPRMLVCSRELQYIIFERLDYDEKAQSRLMHSNASLMQLASWLKWFAVAPPCGWAHGDLKTTHVVILRNGSLAVYDFELLQPHPCGPTQVTTTIQALQVSGAVHQDLPSRKSDHNAIAKQAASTSFDVTHTIPEGACWDTIDSPGKWGRLWDPRWVYATGYTLSQIVDHYG